MKRAFLISNEDAALHRASARAKKGRRDTYATTELRLDQLTWAVPYRNINAPHQVMTETPERVRTLYENFQHGLKLSANDVTLALSPATFTHDDSRVWDTVLSM